MQKPFLTFILFFFFVETISSQTGKGQLDLSKIPVPQWHYQKEYTFDKPSDPQAWENSEPGLNVAFGTTDELFLRCEVPAVNPEPLVWNGTAWRGERLNAQILVWSPDSLEQIRFEASDLIGQNNHKISADNIRLDLVRYVVSNFPYGATGFTCDAPLDSAWLMPDRFESFERFELPGNTVRPVWLKIEVPVDAGPGNYSGTINVKSKEQEVKLKVNLTVQTQVLPNPEDWKFRLDLWQNPWAVAWYFQVEPWSEEHKMLLKKHLRPYADAGGKYITTYAVHSPWSDNSYWIEGAMIEWIRNENGAWHFDYSIFDQYVELAMETGIDEAITIYTPVPWGHRFRYLDKKTENYVYAEWSPDSEEFKKFWGVFLDDLQEHLQQKGWKEKVYLGINENPLEYTLAAAKVIKKHPGKWKITYAGDWHPELTDLLDDYSPVITSEPSPQELKDRKTKGFTTTYYVCCTPPQPNNFVFSKPVEGRYIGWYASAYGYDGFLRWAYDAWPADPMRDARHTLWPAGDCFLVYPGGVSCIRFEKMREGISDYEKIRILKEKAGKSNNKKVKTLMKALDEHLTGLASVRKYEERDFGGETLKQIVGKGNELIKSLSEELAR